MIMFRILRALECSPDLSPRNYKELNSYISTINTNLHTSRSERSSHQSIKRWAMQAPETGRQGERDRTRQHGK